MFVLCLGLIAAMSFANQYLENRLPYVTHVEELKSGKKIESGERQFHIHFSEPMDQKFSGFDRGPDTDAEVCFVKQGGFESDKIKVITVDLKPNKNYQLEVSTAFRNVSGKRIKPYLMEFQTDK